jgi:hypothetical protein
VLSTIVSAFFSSLLDDVHRTVTELRRELRTMRRELKVPALVVSHPDVSKQLVASPVTPRMPRPAPRPSTKKRGNQT